MLASTTRQPLYLVLALAALWAVGESVGQPPSWRLSLMLVGLGAVWNFVTVHTGMTVLFRLPANWPLLGGPFTAEAALYGALNGLALAVIMGAFGLVTGRLSPRDLVRLTPPAFYEAGLVLSVALAFLPQGREALAEIRHAQAVRGHRLRGVRDLPPLFLPLLILALERALGLAEALEARGFISRRGRPARRALALLLAGMLLWLGGVVGLLTPVPRWVGPLSLLAGLGALAGGLRQLGRPVRRTALRARPWTPRDRAAAWAAALSLLSWGLLVWLRPDVWRYDVYPRAALPAFTPVAAVPLLALALPAVVAARPAQRSPLPTRATPWTGEHAPVCSLPIHFERVTFAYPEAPAPVLRDLSLTLAPGAFVVITGPSGSGKSTLLRCINGLVPHASGGRIAGQVRVGAVDALRAGPAVMAAQVGLVIQNPEAGFVADRVEDEVAFALENAGVAPAEIATRVEEALARAGIVALRERALATLSGGERQRVALAAALALRPPILLLDEPLSQLDPAGAEALVTFLKQLHAEGLTIVVAEHRLERLLPLATQVLSLPGDGSVVAGVPVGGEAGTPERRLPAAFTGEALRVVDLTCAYNGQPVLSGLTLTLRRGELVVLTGPNGAGKTTLLKAVVGLLPQRGGRLWLGEEEITGWEVAARCRRIGYLPQEPDWLLFAETVRDELGITLRNHGLPVNGSVDLLLGRLGLTALAGRYPRDLSTGERLRVALGAVTVTRPELLLLDEPTRGLDGALKLALGQLLRGWCAEGVSALVVTHDAAWAARFADRVLSLEAGCLVEQPAPARKAAPVAVAERG